MIFLQLHIKEQCYTIKYCVTSWLCSHGQLKIIFLIIYIEYNIKMNSILK